MTDWIESRTNLARHRKTRQLAEALGIPRVVAVGHLTCWWHRVMEESPDGDLSAWSAADIADAALYEDDPDQFRTALIAAHFLDIVDGVQQPHDWDDYAGRLIDRRRRNRERMRAVRSAERNEPVSAAPEPQNACAPHVSDTVTARAGLPYQPYQTVPTVPDQPESEVAPAAEAVDETFKSALEDAFWEDFGSREAVRDSIAKALSHKSHSNYADQRAFLRSWLREDAARALSRRPGTARNGHSPPPSSRLSAQALADLPRGRVVGELP